MTKKSPLEMIQVKAGWHWRLRATNGRIVADGAEMYSSEAKARNGFKAAAKLAAKALGALDVAMQLSKSFKETNREMEKFRKTRHPKTGKLLFPRFDELQDTMATIITTGAAKNLAGAYRLADRSVPRSGNAKSKANAAKKPGK